jgi:hypothetical protein
MSNKALNSSWIDRANIPLLDGIFDDTLSEEELMEIRSYVEDCLDTEGW